MIHDKDYLKYHFQLKQLCIITHYISKILVFSLGSKTSYTDGYLSSESEKDHSNIFNSKTM